MKGVQLMWRFAAGVLAAAIVSPAWAQDARPVSESKLAGIAFPVAATAIEDDGVFRSTLNAVAALENRTCATVEAFGWRYAQPEAGKYLMDHLIKSLVEAKYKVTELAIKQFENQPVFSATAERENRSLALVQVIENDAATLTLCDTKPKTP